MNKIKINYHNGQIRTSTTFSQLTARFFLQAWYSMQRGLEEVADSWVVMDKNDMFYRDTNEVRTAFQESINDLIKYYDNIYKDIAKGKQLGAWSRDDIEYHILQTISDKGNGVYLKGQLEDFERWCKSQSS